MRIQFLISIAGHLDARFDYAYRPGQVDEVEDSQARAWIASGVAVLTQQAPPFTGFDDIPDPLRVISQSAVKPIRKRGK